MDNSLRQRVIRVMANYLCSLKIDVDDQSLCFVALWDRGFREQALRECMDPARCMARIRQTNNERRLPPDRSVPKGKFATWDMP